MKIALIIFLFVELHQCSSNGGACTREWVLTDIADHWQLGKPVRVRKKMEIIGGEDYRRLQAILVQAVIFGYQDAVVQVGDTLNNFFTLKTKGSSGQSAKLLTERENIIGPQELDFVGDKISHLKGVGIDNCMMEKPYYSTVSEKKVQL